MFFTACTLTENRINQKHSKSSFVQPSVKIQVQFSSLSSKQHKKTLPDLPPKNYLNLWDEIGDKSSLSFGNLEDYQTEIDYYKKNNSHLKRVSKRAEPYLHYILQEVKNRKMPYEIALLPIIESAFLPFAKSSAKAKGLWQIMPRTGDMLGLKRSEWYEGRQDIQKSTNAALNYLEKLYKQNNQDWLLALASYNGGYGNVLKARKKFLEENPDGYIDYWSIRKFLPQETQSYIPKLLAVSYIVENRDAYDIKLEPIKNSAFFAVINLKKAVDMYKVAKKTHTNLALIKNLNSGFLKSVTPPIGNYNLLLPIEKSFLFEDELERNPTFFDVAWTKKYIVQNGDSLSVIAEMHNTSTKKIKKINHLKNNNIRIGKELLIPVKNFEELKNG